jgi:GxxExxY protein
VFDGGRFGFNAKKPRSQGKKGKDMPYEDEEPPYVEPDPELDALARAVIGAAIEVHKQLGGPGLDESLYEVAMWVELRLRNIPFQKQIVIDVPYKGEKIGDKRIDLIVGGRLVVELKAVEQLAPLHSAQLKTYLKITRCRLGLIINFNTILLRDGIKRILNPM